MGSLIFLQNGHRRTRFTNTTPESICRVAIDVGLCRSGRIGGAAGSLILSSKLFTSARFLPPRSGLMNLAVGFNLVFSENMLIYGWSSAIYPNRSLNNDHRKYREYRNSTAIAARVGGRALRRRGIGLRQAD